MNTPAKHEGLHDAIMEYAIKNELTHHELIEHLMTSAVAVLIYVSRPNKLDTDILKVETPAFKVEITLK